MSAKTEILSRIRSAQKQAGLPKSVEVPRDYRRESDLGADELRELLIDRLEDYKATVKITEEGNLASLLQKLLGNYNEVVYAEGMDAQLFDGISGARPDDRNSDPRELNSADAVVTESLVACAQTGTIVIEANELCGRRALTLVPDRHVCIVRGDNTVYGIPEVISAMHPDRPTTWISGPSATSDIELSRVEGVHGPRKLIVVIVK